jgi:hypothetical protein
MANPRNGAFPQTESVRNALEFLESLGYTGGDIHDDLASVLDELESTAAVFTYSPDDVMSVADDIGLEVTENQAEKFCRKHFEGAPSGMQQLVYDAFRRELERLLKAEFGK